jgi:hypothetical protein
LPAIFNYKRDIWKVPKEVLYTASTQNYIAATTLSERLSSCVGLVLQARARENQSLVLGSSRANTTSLENRDCKENELPWARQNPDTWN